MKISFLKNGNFKYKKTEIKENLKDLISAMGFKPTDDNVKIFSTYLGIENGRKPLDNESFNDYYKRTLKLFMKDMQKEAKRKLDEEGKKPVVDSKDVMHKFDNLMHSLAELHNDDVDKREKEAKEKDAASKDKKDDKKENKKGGIKVEDKDKEKELDVPKIIPSISNPAPSKKKPANPEPQRVFDERYGWTQFIEEDTDPKKTVDEYMRRQNMFQRIVIEHYANYTENSFRNFLYGFLRIPESDSPNGWYTYDPNFNNEYYKEKMFGMHSFRLNKKGKVDDVNEFKTSYKNTAHFYLNVVNPKDDFAPTKDDITVALEEVDKITQAKAPEDKKMGHHMGLSDKSFDELKNEMLFENAFYSLKWIYAGTYDKPLETIEIKQRDKGQNTSKAFLAVNILKGLKEVYDNRSPIAKRIHKDELSKIETIQKFLKEKVGLSEQFIKDELVDENLREKMGVCLEREAKEKEESEKKLSGMNIDNQNVLAKDSDLKIKSNEVSKIKENDLEVDKDLNVEPQLSIAPKNNKKKNE